MNRSNQSLPYLISDSAKQKEYSSQNPKRKGPNMSHVHSSSNFASPTKDTNQTQRNKMQNQLLLDTSIASSAERIMLLNEKDFSLPFSQDELSKIIPQPSLLMQNASVDHYRLPNRNDETQTSLPEASKNIWSAK